MRTSCMVVVGAVGFLATQVNAHFTGFTAEYITLGNGHVIQNVYANFTNANDRLLNIYNTNITTTNPGGFHQSAANPTWKPSSTQYKNTSDDSWVTIGTNPDGSQRANGLTEGDPNFINFDDSNDSTDFSCVENDGGGAGWFYVPPDYGYGDAFDQNRVLVAHFVWVAPPDGGVATTGWQVTIQMILAGQSQTSSATPPTQEFDYDHVPSPSVLALLAMGVTPAARRRQRTL